MKKIEELHGTDEYCKHFYFEAQDCDVCRVTPEIEERVWREAVEYLMQEYNGCQPGTLVSYAIASDVLKVEAKRRGVKL